MEPAPLRLTAGLLAVAAAGLLPLAVAEVVLLVVAPLVHARPPLLAVVRSTADGSPRFPPVPHVPSPDHDDGCTRRVGTGSGAGRGSAPAPPP
ncbi:hypothetical protein NUM3379_10730 [Kineococcus sp. NUM-3379]